MIIENKKVKQNTVFTELLIPDNIFSLKVSKKDNLPIIDLNEKEFYLYCFLVREKDKLKSSVLTFETENCMLKIMNMRLQQENRKLLYEYLDTLKKNSLINFKDILEITMPYKPKKHFKLIPYDWFDVIYKHFGFKGVYVYCLINRFYFSEYGYSIISYDGLITKTGYSSATLMKIIDKMECLKIYKIERPGWIRNKEKEKCIKRNNQYHFLDDKAVLEKLQNSSKADIDKLIKIEMEDKSFRSKVFVGKTKPKEVSPENIEKIATVSKGDSYDELLEELTSNFEGIDKQIIGKLGKLKAKYSYRDIYDSVLEEETYMEKILSDDSKETLHKFNTFMLRVVDKIDKENEANENMANEINESYEMNFITATKHIETIPIPTENQQDNNEPIAAEDYDFLDKDPISSVSEKTSNVVDFQDFLTKMEEASSDR
ncbi:hypothetical protein [Clostridium sp. CF012]|uniref:hypothetical protein n=1 Tax=Clostridium sp. CF012 TaxID=2843319 RepID=UPI001C0AC320|nr:hypothetical protein [Clostridium sp. CF012]MBU3142232.1 hypothetical protein [Clostridium sp. CF012]